MLGGSSSSHDYDAPSAAELIEKLCANCRSIDIQSFPLENHSDIIANSSTISGAKEGCPFCRLVSPRWETGVNRAGDDIILDAITSNGFRDGEEIKVIEGFRGTSKKRELVFVAEEGICKSWAAMCFASD